jgi:cytoskeletal protein CcmA (bactofilin family)
MNHFDEMTGLLYLEQQLDAAHAQEVRVHVAGCNECRSLLRALELEGVWLRQSLEADDESVPARLVQAPERGGTPWGWLSAFGLSAGGAYTMWSGFIEPWRAQAAQSGFTQGNLLTMLFFSGAFWKGWDAMRSLTEFLAVATLGMLVIWLFRRHLRRVTTLAVVMGMMLLALACAPAGQAAQIEHGNPNYTLPAGETVKTDLFVFADVSRIDGDVEGDVISWSRSLTVNGHVRGDVIAFAQDVHVNGPVDGNVRVFCQTLTLNSVVSRNVSAWAGDMNLNEKAKVDGSVTLGSGDADLSGEVVGDLLAGTGDLDIHGILDRNADIRAGHLSIGPKAEIKGWVKFKGHQQPEVSPSAKLAIPIEVTIEKRGSDSSRYSSPRYYWHQALFWGASFIFGLAMLLLMPGFFFDAAGACKRTMPAIGFGALFLIALPILAVIVCITIVGIGVGIAALMFWVISIYAAQVIVGMWLGDRLLGEAVGFGAGLGRMALGLLILRAIGVIPYLGVWFSSLVVCLGLGAIVLAIYRHMRPHLATATAVAV